MQPRVLGKLGLKVVAVRSENEATRTESEELFEEYLYSRGHLDFEFEKQFDSSSARLDFALLFKGDQILFEIKEFHATPGDFKTGFTYFDPYGPIREKIQAAWKKFKDFKQYCCCLVLYNRQKPSVDLGWQFVYGAMLGNLAYRMPFDKNRGEFVAEKTMSGFYGGGGKMVRTKQGEAFAPQNTRISAIVVLTRFQVGKKRFDIEMARQEKKLGRDLSFEEFWDSVESARGTERDLSLRELSVVVCENPDAPIQLPVEMFRGPYDKRYGIDIQAGDRITRLFAGEQIVALEEQEKQAAFADNQSPERENQ